MDDDDEAPCGYCGAQRALLYCAQHAARLCLPCDMIVHDASRSHERAPLCDGCHAAGAAVRCMEHQAAVCALCAARCVAEQHRQRPARTFTGSPGTDDLMRILSGDDGTPPSFPDPDTCWVPELVNIELPVSSSSTWDDTMASEELPPDRCKGDNLFNQQQQIVSETTGAVPLLMGDDELLTMQQQDWPNLDDNSFEPQASSSLGYELSLCSETIMPSDDAVMQSLTSNSAAACQFSSFSTHTCTGSNVNVCTGGMPSGEFLFGGAGLPPAVSSSCCSSMDQEPPDKQPGQDMEARMKKREKRQQAKQRYNDKKKKRRFGKQIMYESRKARADTRNRVKGRFAKSSSNTDQI